MFDRERKWEVSIPARGRAGVALRSFVSFSLRPVEDGITTSSDIRIVTLLLCYYSLQRSALCNSSIEILLPCLVTSIRKIYWLLLWGGSEWMADKSIPRALTTNKSIDQFHCVNRLSKQVK